MKNKETAPKINQATELEYLCWFRLNVDLGPNHDEIIESMHERFKYETGMDIPPEGLECSKNLTEKIIKNIAEK